MVGKVEIKTCNHSISPIWYTVYDAWIVAPSFDRFPGSRLEYIIIARHVDVLRAALGVNIELDIAQTT